jgi:hypothetical protein
MEVAEGHRSDQVEACDQARSQLVGGRQEQLHAPAGFGRQTIARHARQPTGHGQISPRKIRYGAAKNTWTFAPVPVPAAGSIAGIQAVVAFSPDALPARIRPDELGYALDAPGAAATVIGERFGLQYTSPWARINVLTRGRLLAPVPAG